MILTLLLEGQSCLHNTATVRGSSEEIRVTIQENNSNFNPIEKLVPTDNLTKEDVVEEEEED